jgi:hypothetical protein
LVFIWRLGFISHSCEHFSSITSFMNTSHAFSFIKFSFQKIGPFSIFTKKMQVWDEENKPSNCMINQNIETCPTT